MAATTEPPWEELQGNLRGFIGRRVKNPADVDDLVQRVLFQIHRGLGSLRDTERLHAWVYRTARNVITDYYRSPTHRREVAAGDTGDMTGSSLEASTQHDDAEAFRDLAGCMAPLLRQLPASYFEAITLTDLQGMNQADAARRTGISVSGMKSRVQRGRKQLKAILEECCSIQLDRRGVVMNYEPRRATSCEPCGSCEGAASSSDAADAPVTGVRGQAPGISRDTRPRRQRP
jgi:RNA polymerase sigma-70 factor, ECF subfamily